MFLVEVNQALYALSTTFIKTELNKKLFAVDLKSIVSNKSCSEKTSELYFSVYYIY